MSTNNTNIFNENLKPQEIDFISKISGFDIFADPGKYNTATIDTLFVVFTKYRRRMDGTAIVKAKNEFSTRVNSLPSYCR